MAVFPSVGDENTWAPKLQAYIDQYAPTGGGHAVAKGELIIRAADYPNLQGAHDACPTGGAIQFEPGNTPTQTAPLQVSKPIRLVAHTGYDSRIIFNGCNGIEVAAGVSDFHMENIEVAQATRYSTTANTLIGIHADGATGTRPFNHTYEHVYVDGFQTAFLSRYLWSSVFHDFKCDYGLIGMDIYGLSENNMVSDSSISVSRVAGSIGIRLYGHESPTVSTAVGSEGWQIHDSLIIGGETDIDVIGYAHIDLHDNIIDYASMYGIRLRDNGLNFVGNVDIHDNYIAMTGAGGVAAIQSANTITNTVNVKNRIHHNHLTVYTGSTCTYGINQSGAQGLIKAHGNTLKGFSSADIFVQSSDNDIQGNDCQSGMANAILGIAGQRNIVANNTGAVYLPGTAAGSPWAYQTVGGKKVATGVAAPTLTTLAWAQGDRVVNALPAVGQPKAWVCTVAGSPGTWVSEGNL